MLWPNGEPPRKKRAHWEGGKGGYAAEPGTGPKVETCGSCQHHRVRSLSRDYHKCAIGRNSGGPGSDIRIRAPACKHWVVKIDGQEREKTPPDPKAERGK